MCNDLISFFLFIYFFLFLFFFFLMQNSVEFNGLLIENGSYSIWSISLTRGYLKDCRLRIKFLIYNFIVIESTRVVVNR